MAFRFQFGAVFFVSYFALLASQNCELNASRLVESLRVNLTTPFCTVKPFYNVSHSCSYQLASHLNGSCQISPTSQSELCGAKNFIADKICNSLDACGIYIKTTLDGDLDWGSSYITRLNVSITSPSAHTVDIKYSIHKTSDQASEDRCMNFVFQEPPTHEIPAYFDCGMRRVQETSNFLLTYIVNDEYGQILMKVPHGPTLAAGNVPFYIHVLSEADGTLRLRTSRMLVTLQAYSASALMGQPQPLYRVNLYKKNCDVCDWTSITTTVVDTTDSATYVDRWRDLYTAVVDASFKNGEYKVVVDPVCKDVDGNLLPMTSNLTNSLSLNITVQEMSVAAILGICLGFAVILMLTLTVVYVIRLYRRRRQIIEKCKKKTLCLIYKDISKAHTDSVTALRSFFMKNFNLTVWMDRTDILETRDKNPHNWSVSCVERADVVAVIVPPEPSMDSSYRPIYPHNFQLGCEHLGIRIKRILNSPDAKFDKLCAVVLLPDSNLSQLPQPLRPYTQFHFPKDALAFEYYVWQEQLRPIWLGSFLSGALLPLLNHREKRIYEIKFHDEITCQDRGATERRTEVDKLQLVDGREKDDDSLSLASDLSDRNELKGIKFYGDEEPDETDDSSTEEMIVDGVPIRSIAFASKD